MPPITPIRGLTADDIEVKLGSKKAKILTFEPLETNEKVGLNIVMVVDNSSSMKRRNAIKPLLSAMQAFLKIMRPIDTIHMIVFDDDHTMQIDGRDLHVKTLTSNNAIDLKGFLDDAFDKGLSSKTVIYEAMAAGMAAMREMPEKANKFFVVFTDGEDINSAFKGDVVVSAARGDLQLRGLRGGLHARRRAESLYGNLCKRSRRQGVEGHRGHRSFTDISIFFHTAPLPVRGHVPVS